MGWDLPELLLKYVVTKYDFGDSLSTLETLPYVLRLMKILSEKGNAKELFVKAAECISGLSVRLDIDHSESVQEQYTDVMFFLCYELLMHTLRRIKTQYPSRFATTATSVLLSFVARNMPEMELLTLSVVLRRLFTFARDFEMAEPDEPVAEAEGAMVQKLLQSYVTWVMDLCFQRFSVKWSERLFYEIRAGVSAQRDKSQRTGLYEPDVLTGRLVESLERIAQLTHSFDMDTMALFRELVDKEVDEPVSTGGDESDDSREIFRDMSNDGIIMLATELKFESREVDGGSGTPELTFAQVVKLANKYLQREDGSLAPLGVQDALCFWALWVTQDITEDAVQAVDADEFMTFLRLLFMMSAMSNDKDTRFVAYSLAAKLLAMHKPEVAFEFIEDTLENCPFQNVQDAAIRILKSLCLGVPAKPAANAADYAKASASLESRAHAESVDDVAAKVSGLSLGDKSQPRIELSADRVQRIRTSVDRVLNHITSGTGVSSASLPVLLSWLNFLTVVNTEPDYALSVAKRVEAFVPKSNDGLSLDAKQRKAILLLSIDSLKRKWGNSEPESTKP